MQSPIARSFRPPNRALALQADRPKDGGLGESEGAANAEPKQSQSARAPRVINSAALMEGKSQLAILHNETMYFLRQTRFGKLILTK